jgi:hypothetical protein
MYGKKIFADNCCGAQRRSHASTSVRDMRRRRLGTWDSTVLAISTAVRSTDVTTKVRISPP